MLSQGRREQGGETREHIDTQIVNQEKVGREDQGRDTVAMHQESNPEIYGYGTINVSKREGQIDQGKNQEKEEKEKAKEKINLEKQRELELEKQSEKQGKQYKKQEKKQEGKQEDKQEGKQKEEMGNYGMKNQEGEQKNEKKQIEVSQKKQQIVNSKKEKEQIMEEKNEEQENILNEKNNNIQKKQTKQQNNEQQKQKQKQKDQKKQSIVYSTKKTIQEEKIKFQKINILEEQKQQQSINQKQYQTIVKKLQKQNQDNEKDKIQQSISQKNVQVCYQKQDNKQQLKQNIIEKNQIIEKQKQIAILQKDSLIKLQQIQNKKQSIFENKKQIICQQNKQVFIRSQIKQLVQPKKNEIMFQKNKHFHQQIKSQVSSQLRAKSYKSSVQDLQQQMKSYQSSERTNGKISNHQKALIHNKKVFEVVKDIQKHDDRKGFEIVLEPKIQKNTLADLSKLDGKISLTSNVMSITVGEIFDQQKQDTERLIEQIHELRNQLHQFEKRHVSIDIDIPSPQRRMKQKAMFGRIVKKGQLNSSRISENQQTNLQKQSRVAENPYSSNISQCIEGKRQNMVHSVHKMSATTGFQRTEQFKPGHFRIKSRAKPNQVQLPQEQQQLQPAQSMSRVSEYFQRVEHRIPFDYQMAVQFTEGARQIITSQLIDVGSEWPDSKWNKKQLLQLARKSFEKFKVDIYRTEQGVISIKKYKNCVLFALTEQKTMLWYYEGRFYFGGWRIGMTGQGQKQGWGYDLLLNRSVYVGQFRDGKRHGPGFLLSLTQQQDSLYIGQWQQGQKHGKGRQIEVDGSQYVGDWIEGKKHGFGKIVVSPTEGFEGMFAQGVKNGHGTERFKNKDVYSGGYLDGRFHGKGRYDWANGSSYEGDFEGGLRHGQGTWHASSQPCDSYVGLYKQDKKEGKGIYTWKDGTKYDGHFQNDLKHGEGTIQYGNGRTVRYQWNMGDPLQPIKPGAEQRAKTRQKRRTIMSESKSKATQLSLRFDKLQPC